MDSLPVHLLELLVELVRPGAGKNALPGRGFECSGTASPGLRQRRILRGDLVGPDQFEEAMLHRGRLARDGQSLADRPVDKLPEAIGMPFNSGSRTLVVLPAILDAV